MRGDRSRRLETNECRYDAISLMYAGRLVARTSVRGCSRPRGARISRRRTRICAPSSTVRAASARRCPSRTSPRALRARTVRPGWPLGSSHTPQGTGPSWMTAPASITSAACDAILGNRRGQPRNLCPGLRTGARDSLAVVGRRRPHDASSPDTARARCHHASATVAAPCDARATRASVATEGSPRSLVL